MTDVVAKRFDDIDDVIETPGAFEYYRSGERYPAGMIYCCPCGCGRAGTLRFRPRADPGPSWQWDGDIEKPTLTPSVHDNPQGTTHWHGWLTAGVWKSC